MCAGEGEREYPMQMYQASSGDPVGRDLQRENQEVESLRGRQLPYIDDPGPQALHLAVQQALVGVRVSGEDQDLHRDTSSVRIPAPYTRWSSRTRTAPLARLRQAGTSRRA